MDQQLTRLLKHKLIIKNKRFFWWVYWQDFTTILSNEILHFSWPWRGLFSIDKLMVGYSLRFTMFQGSRWTEIRSRTISTINMFIAKVSYWTQHNKSCCQGIILYCFAASKPLGLTIIKRHFLLSSWIIFCSYSCRFFSYTIFQIGVYCVSS